MTNQGWSTNMLPIQLQIYIHSTIQNILKRAVDGNRMNYFPVSWKIFERIVLGPLSKKNNKTTVSTYGALYQTLSNVGSMHPRHLLILPRVLAPCNLSIWLLKSFLRNKFLPGKYIYYNTFESKETIRWKDPGYFGGSVVKKSWVHDMYNHLSMNQQCCRYRVNFWWHRQFEIGRQCSTWTTIQRNGYFELKLWLI